MQDSGQLAERTGLDRVDQRTHTLAADGDEVDLVGSAAATLGHMRRRSPLARIHEASREQRIARGDEAHPLGAFHELADERLVEVGLGPVEIEARDGEGIAAQAVRFGLEELLQACHAARLLGFGHGAHIVGRPPNATPA